MQLRIGNGYDIHRLVPGRPLILGGVRLEHPAGLGLDGHSDADVLAERGLHEFVDEIQQGLIRINEMILTIWCSLDQKHQQSQH